MPLNGSVGSSYGSPFHVSDKCVRYVFYPMVPVPVHEVICGYRRGVRDVRIQVGRLFQAALYGTYIHDLRLVRRQLEFTDSVGYVAELYGLAESFPAFLPFDWSGPYLTVLYVYQPFAVKTPSRVAEAFARACQLLTSAAVGIDEIQVVAGPVVLDGCIGYTI